MAVAYLEGGGTIYLLFVFYCRHFNNYNLYKLGAIDDIHGELTFGGEVLGTGEGCFYQYLCIVA